MERNAGFLSKVPLLSSLPAGMLARLGAQMKERETPADSMLFSKGDPGDSLFIILKGEVKIVLYSKEGREIVLAKFGPGDFFGEMALLDREPRSANAITLSDCTLLQLDHAAFACFIESEPSAALDLLREISRRLRNTDEKVGDLALMDVFGRVARFLIRLAQSEGERTEYGLLILKRPTHQEIANMVGTARETVSRAMSHFQKNGYVRPQGEGLFILSEEKFTERFVHI